MIAPPKPGAAPAGALKKCLPLLLLSPFLYLVADAVADFNRLLMVLLCIIPFAVGVFLNVELGVYILLGYSTFVMLIKRLMPSMDGNQVGLVLDALLLLISMRMALDLFTYKRWGAFKTPVTVPFLAFMGYLFLQVFNPMQPSLQFGIYGSRDTLRLLGFFLVLVYFRGTPKIKRFLTVWLGLLFFEALWGIKQHHIGLLYQEHEWLYETNSWRTHVLQGYVRVFGTVGDAATVGFISLTGALLLIGLGLTSRGWKLVAIGALAMPMLYAMVLSYSRGPMVALVAGVGVMLIVSRNWKLAIACVMAGMLGVGALAANGDTRLVDRIMTATNPTEDASWQVRMGYVDEYLPRILTNPFGTGLYTAGASGLSITGGRPIFGTTIGVPTDNQYFKFGLELGWVGLAIFVWLLLSIWFHTWHIYRSLSDPFLKAFALGLLGVFSSYIVGAVSNDILVQKPMIEWFYMAVGFAMLLGQHAKRPAAPAVSLALRGKTR